MTQIQLAVTAQAESFGIKVVDLRIGRTEYPDQTRESVFDRMRTERQREARELRAQGNEEAQKIRARADLERTILIANAERTSQILQCVTQEIVALAQRFNSSCGILEGDNKTGLEPRIRGD